MWTPLVNRRSGANDRPLADKKKKDNLGRTAREKTATLHLKESKLVKAADSNLCAAMYTVSHGPGPGLAGLAGHGRRARAPHCPAASPWSI